MTGQMAEGAGIKHEDRPPAHHRAAPAAHTTRQGSDRGSGPGGELGAQREGVGGQTGIMGRR